MSSCKILYVCQEITPYLAENDVYTVQDSVAKHAGKR